MTASQFPLPQISMPLSYRSIHWNCVCLWQTILDFIGAVVYSGPTSLERGQRPHLKCNHQLSPPCTIGEELSVTVCIDGTHQWQLGCGVLLDGSWASKGHIHFTVLCRNSGTSSAWAAPIIFPGINPSRFAFLITSIFPAKCFWKLSRSLIKSLKSLSFSTKIVLGRWCAGVWSVILCTVLSKEDKALSLGHHPKDFIVSQYLNYVLSCACLQELQKIPEHKDQGAKRKN